VLLAFPASLRMPTLDNRGRLRARPESRPWTPPLLAVRAGGAAEPSACMLPDACTVAVPHRTDPPSLHRGAARGAARDHVLTPHLLMACLRRLPNTTW